MMEGAGPWPIYLLASLFAHQPQETRRAVLPDLLRNQWERLLDYSPWEVIIELVVIWILVWVIYRFVRGTRAAGAFKGVLVLVVLSFLVLPLVLRTGLLPRVSALYDKVLGLAAIALIVTFQPELRRALIRIGEAPFFRMTQREVRPVIDAVVGACTFLSKNKFGAIIAFERSTGLRELAEQGKGLNADVSSHLLSSIFWPNNPLHDMGVIIRGPKLVAAGVQFPLADAEDMPDPQLGTRHRAAMGLSKLTDAIIVIVSEETGAIAIAEGRELRRWLTPDQLRAELERRLVRRAAAATETADEPDAGGMSSEGSEP